MGKNKDEPRQYFLFLLSFYTALEEVKDNETKLQLYEAIAKYGLFRKEPNLSDKTPLFRLFWTLIFPILQKGWIRSDNGKKGGAPANNKNAKKKREKRIEPPPINLDDYKIWNENNDTFCSYAKQLGFNLEKHKDVNELWRFLNYYDENEWITTNYKINNWMDALKEWFEVGKRQGFFDYML